jgi:hypothetical protein
MASSELLHERLSEPSFLSTLGMLDSYSATFLDIALLIVFTDDDMLEVLIEAMVLAALLVILLVTCEMIVLTLPPSTAPEVLQLRVRR